MGTYRLEAASTGRAGCQNKECKEEKLKIGKGELRLGTWVDTERFQSFFWRHWGCVTPKIIGHLNEAVEEASGDSKDLDAIDGFEELPSEYQEKVRKALEQGHVDDEDWKGDTEMNRPGMTGFRKRAPKKKKADDEEADTASEKEEKTPKSKKRGRTQTDKDKPEEKATVPKAKRAKKGSRAKQESDTEDDDDLQQESDEEEVQPKPTVTKRGRVSRAAAEEKAPKASAKQPAKRQRKSLGEDGDEAEPVEEKPKRGRRKKST
ncbi:PARP-type zinc finger-containing protein C2A9.07c [Aspergillus udagawae]|nr:PARP-type zinc finger-containing protein C2A9.07c [Aspergillus udagawae]